jgi:hypothetical protein
VDQRAVLPADQGTTRYQFTQPFIIDSSATTREFGLQPIPLDEALRDTAARLRS